MASQRASDRAVYELLARSPELQGRLEAFLRDHPDKMPQRQRQVLMRSMEKAARDPRVGLALRDDEGDCEWWPEPTFDTPRAPFAVPMARGKFNLEADCRRDESPAAPAPESTGWRWMLLVMWSHCVLIAATLGSAACQFWRRHVDAARISRRVGRSRHIACAVAPADIDRRAACVGRVLYCTALQLHPANRGPPSRALMRTFAHWPAMRKVRLARA